MKHGDIEGQLNDYVDGVLPAPAATQIETHLTTCDSCRAAVDRLRVLRKYVEAAPRAIQPPRDLWPEIAERLGEPRDRATAPPRPAWRLLAAAALLLVVATAAVTISLVRDGSGRSGDHTVVGGPRVGTTWESVEVQYGRAIVELEEALQIARERLTPETIALVERNLRIIDEAIAEARAALVADPASEEVWKALSRRYEDRLDLLRQVSRLATRS